MTQDLGLAQEKYEDYQYDESIYVIGDEQKRAAGLTPIAHGVAFFVGKSRIARRRITMMQGGTMQPA